MDAIFKIIDDTTTVLSEVNIISHPFTIPILGGLVLLLLVWLMLSIRRKKASQLLNTKQHQPTKQKTDSQLKSQVKPLSAEDQAYTEKFKKSVAGLDLDLKEEISQAKKATIATPPLTSKQKRELTLDLKALKELLDGSHINQEQYDKKVLELKEAYGG